MADEETQRRIVVGLDAIANQLSKLVAAVESLEAAIEDIAAGLPRA